MLAYTLKNILELVPEAMPLVKQASIEQDMPLDNKDSTLATALTLKYHEKVAYKAVDVFAIEKVAQAVKAYGLEADVKALGDRMVAASIEKKASENVNVKEDYLLKEASFEGELTGFSDIQVVSAKAAELHKEAQEIGITPSEEVLRYSGYGYMDKEAAVKALANRFYETKNPNFVKIARAVHNLPAGAKPETIRDICDTISGMDKEAGLTFKGYNFFKETVLVKAAELRSALNVKLCGKDVPFEKIARLGKDRIGAFIGADVASEYDAGPAHFKQVAETLPHDLQRVLLNLSNS
ncbi:hypothetical protein D3C87_459780 [compost metagenome]